MRTKQHFDVVFGANSTFTFNSGFLTLDLLDFLLVEKGFHKNAKKREIFNKWQ